MHSTTILSAFALLSSPVWGSYVLQDDYFSGNAFFNQFSFFTAADPTHGFVQYQSQSSAQSMGLLGTSNGGAQMRVDSKNVQPNGRPSVRLVSNKSYSSGLILVDVAHMPGGICGTWPAFWMVGPNWPNSGEIDIIEGVNDQTVNDMTLHTGPNCTLSSSGSGYSGSLVSTTCTSSGSNNNGCGIAARNTNTYGSGFNSAQGGLYATEIAASAINIWFFPRSAGYPSDIKNNAPNPAGWGQPLAKFAGSCNIASSFQNMQIVFDTTFCGDWAGNVWGNSASCSAKASSCSAYVANNPTAFQGAYWDVRGLKVFKASGSKVRDVDDEDAGEIEDVESVNGTTVAAGVPVEWTA